MLVRFRRRHCRLSASLLESHRVRGKRHPCSKHVAELGSIAMPMDVAGRFAFWQALYQRLARLGNRISPEQQAAIMSKVHERIPMVSIPEQRSLQRENAEEDVRFWDTMEEMHAEQAEGHNELADMAGNRAKDHAAEATKAREAAAKAKERLVLLERGEAVSGGVSRADVGALLKSAGWTAADIKHALVLAELERLGLADAFIREEAARLHPVRNASTRRRARQLLAHATATRSGADIDATPHDRGGPKKED
jgi:hypothetical protein